MRSKKAIYNIITNLLLQLVTIACGFIVPKIIIGKFGSETNGLVSSITQFLAYITLLESGFGPVVKAMLYKPIAKHDNKTIKRILKASEKFFRTIAIIFIAYILALFFIYPLIINQSFDRFLTISLIAIIGISTFAEYYFGMTYKLFLQAKQKTYITSIIQIITYILSTAAIIILAIYDSNIQTIKLISGLIFVLRPVLQNIYVKKKYHINLRGVDGDYGIKQKWDGLAQHIAAVIHANTDITILTVFRTLSDVSIYSVYYLVISGIKKIIQSFTNGIDASFGDMIAKKEKKNLIEKFSTYECAYYMIATIVFTCTLLLITPFVGVYTKGITDAEYIQPTFGILLVISEYIWAIRLPYSSITLAAGHFKETRKGAWIECITNIIISVTLVNWLGLIGVAIGTIVAMTIRTIEFVYHTNKYILGRSAWQSAKKILLVAAETILIIIISSIPPHTDIVDYSSWIIYALFVLTTSIVVTILLNYLFSKNELKKIKEIIKQLLSKKRTDGK